MDRSQVPESGQTESSVLLARWQEHDSREALDELLEREVRMLRARIRRQVGGSVDPALSASDVAQEAVLRLLDQEQLPTFDSPAALRAYLWTTAWRLLATRLRKAGRNAVQFDPSETSGLAAQLENSGGLGTADRVDRATVLGLTLNLLDSDERELLQLAYFEGLDPDAIAERLGVSRAAAQMRRVRAERALAKKLRRWSEILDQ